MGKYMNKSKASGDITLMEVSISPQSSLGVRTRAKTLALQQLQQQQQQSQKQPSPDPDSYYLQLRSRRLEKRSDGKGAAVDSRLSVAEGCSGTFGDGAECNNDCEASFGETNLEFDSRDRSTRESTPCSLIRNLYTLRTPSSTTRRSSSIAINQRVRNESQKTIPTALDMEEFFAQAEQQQQKLFIDKYNYDIISDMPLPGRYEWEQVIH